MDEDREQVESSSFMRDESYSHSNTEVVEEPSDHYSPDRLIRREQKAVVWMRVLLFAVLLVCAALTGTGVAVLVMKSEKKSFRDNYDATADQLLAAVRTQMGDRYKYAQSIVSVISSSMLATKDATPSSLDIHEKVWKRVSQRLVMVGLAETASWAPWLESEQERLEFEEVNRNKIYETGFSPTCFLCGENGTFGNGDLPLWSMHPEFASCRYLEEMALYGHVQDGFCGAWGAYMKTNSNCSCVDLPKGQEKPKTVLQVPESIYRFDDSGMKVAAPFRTGPYVPINEMFKTQSPGKKPYKFDLLSSSRRGDAVRAAHVSRTPAIGRTHRSEDKEDILDEVLGTQNGPGATLAFPVMSDSNISQALGIVSIDFLWTKQLKRFFAMPALSYYSELDITSNCTDHQGGRNIERFCFQIAKWYDIDNMARLAEISCGQREPKYEDMGKFMTFSDYENHFVAQFSTDNFGINKTANYEGACYYQFGVYPTSDFEEYFKTNDPYIYATVVAGAFVFSSFVFLLYDMVVTRRQNKVMASAKETNDIVSSLFPDNIRDRMMAQTKDSSSAIVPSKVHMRNFLHDAGSTAMLTSEPIADLFPRVTVMFLDIVNFTGWSSERGPGQVFKLLETLYGAFDEIAKPLRIFKVETIGDSYMAACGIPEARKNHAVIMSLFAKRCLKKMNDLTNQLEVILGPGTADLRARVGLHSGPVTAGVLRGEKARFQLFGDTVNTAARMEGSGKAHRIQCSKATMELLVKAGKENWVEPRADIVSIKGKGKMETYWVHPSAGPASRTSGDGVLTTGSSNDSMIGAAEKNLRLVNWNVEVLYTLLQRVVADRGGLSESPGIFREEQTITSQTGLVIDEVTEELDLPPFDSSKISHLPKKVNIPPHVKNQLHVFVTTIANLYRDVPFHNFDHASHVIMSTNKLMERIVMPDGVNYEGEGADAVAIASQIHDATYGISSDPLLQFTAVFSALIHDVDHTGLTNGELIDMKSRTAVAYQSRSVAEQNSIDIAWGVLMDCQFEDLRACIYSNQQELHRFRQLLVNAVIATDIADKALKTARESRWDNAFKESNKSDGIPEFPEDDTDVKRKATIVFDYIIQASDIAHTMQHWHTYQKFNARLFEERYLAWVKGYGADKNPADGWYKGELWFFDNYIIPLANKLHKCGVFGVSHDEFLNYAVENRREWVDKGEAVVKEMRARCEEKYGNYRQEQTPDQY